MSMADCTIHGPTTLRPEPFIFFWKEMPHGNNIFCVTHD